MKWFGRGNDELLISLIRRVDNAEDELKKYKQEVADQFEEFRIRLSAPAQEVAPKRKSDTDWLSRRRQLEGEHAEQSTVATNNA